MDVELIRQGAMLSVLDSDKRLADHFGGKVTSLPSVLIAETGNS